MIIDQLPAIIIVVPLLIAILINVIGFFARSLCYPIAVITSAISFLSSIGILFKVIDSGSISYRLGGWQPPWGIEYLVDSLNAYILVIITSMALLSIIFSRRSAERDYGNRLPQFYCIMLLLLTGLVGMTITGDAFNLYVLIEITSISCYALIAKGDDKSPLASFNYLIIGTVGACFYLLGVGYLYIMTGSLNISDLSSLLPDLYGKKVILTAFIFFVVGIAIKMALFPLHGWLPNAYTHAPDSASAFMASTVTKVSAYVMIRVMFTLFHPQYPLSIVPILPILGMLSVVAMIYGCILALAQRNLKRIFSYIIIAEVGYIIVGISTATKVGFTGSVLHIMNDAIMMACLFFTAGAIAYKTGSRNIDEMRGIYKKMPFTSMAFAIGAVSVVGVPPTCGFFSKWYLISGTLQSGDYHYTVALILSSLISAIVFYRILQSMYSSNKDITTKSDDAPVSMLVPVYVTAVAIFVVGLMSGTIISTVIEHTIPQGFR